MENYIGLFFLFVKMVFKCKVRVGYVKVGVDSGLKSEWGEFVVVNYSLGFVLLWR